MVSVLSSYLSNKGINTAVSPPPRKILRPHTGHVLVRHRHLLHTPSRDGWLHFRHVEMRAARWCWLEKKKKKWKKRGWGIGPPAPTLRHTPMVICLWYPYVFICFPWFLMYIISLVQKKKKFLPPPPPPTLRHRLVAFLAWGEPFFLH